MWHEVGHLFQRGRYVRQTFKRFDTNAIDATGFAGSFRLLGSETNLDIAWRYWGSSAWWQGVCVLGRVLRSAQQIGGPHSRNAGVII
jgi:hypothetical protein